MIPVSQCRSPKKHKAYHAEDSCWQCTLQDEGLGERVAHGPTSSKSLVMAFGPVLDKIITVSGWTYTFEDQLIKAIDAESGNTEKHSYQRQMAQALDAINGLSVKDRRVLSAYHDDSERRALSHAEKYRAQELTRKLRNKYT